MADELSTPQRDGQGVSVGKNERGAWCVFIDGQVVSDHRTRDGAATAANNHLRAGPTSRRLTRAMVEQTYERREHGSV